MEYKDRPERTRKREEERDRERKQNVKRDTVQLSIFSGLLILA